MSSPYSTPPDRSRPGQSQPGRVRPDDQRRNSWNNRPESSRSTVLATLLAVVGLPLAALSTWFGYVQANPPDSPPTAGPNTTTATGDPTDTRKPKSPVTSHTTKVTTEQTRTTLLSDAFASTGNLNSMEYLSVDGDQGYSKPRSVSLRCGYTVTLHGLEDDQYHTLKAALVPLAIPQDEAVTVRDEILLDNRKVLDEDVSSSNSGRPVSLNVEDASTLTVSDSLCDLRRTGRSMTA